MPNEFRMPSLGPDMESGTLVEWRVKPGDVVKRGDIIALVETDKGVIDVEVFADGTVEKLLVESGAHVPVGTVLAKLSGEAAGSGMPTVEPAAPVASTIAPTPAPVATREASAPAAAEHRHKVSPAARARAKALGVDLDVVTGSGPGGVITIEDIVRAAAPTIAHPVVEPAHDMRAVIARAMSRSKREIPHYYLSVTCSFAKARAWLDKYNATATIEARLLPSALLLKAVALAARAMPDFNGFYKDDTYHGATEVHVGMAIAMRGGRLVAPAILNTDQKSLQVVMNELRDLATRVRAGHMRASELSMPTITVTSLAEEGIDAVIPAIYPPQVAIVGIGSIVERPWVEEGVVKPTPVVTLTVAADHRVTDGRAGARFLAHIRDALQSPEHL
jgi:pyruvate dehydrogenase E2 component (dihydrolipoamide acetyltransferase)